MTTEKDYILMGNVLKLACAGACGTGVQLDVVQLEHTFQLAMEQKVLPLVACVAKCDFQTECLEPFREQLLNVVQSVSSVNMIRRQRIMHLIQELADNGIAVKVLKGYPVADCYAYPDCRDSVDTDLLIDISQEHLACQVLEDKGFTVHARETTSQHAICQHPKYGMVELHVKPYAELVDEVWFKGIGEEELISEASITVSTLDGAYETLGKTDHLIFLALHMVKHFIMGGLSIRMMIDIALFFRQHKDAINTERFWTVMKHLKYSTFINAVLRVMMEYGPFSRLDFPGVDDVGMDCVDLLMNDLEQGGYMGAKQKRIRYESGMAYNRQVMLKSKSSVQYISYMLLWKIRTGAGYMFPSVSQLKKQYSIAAKCWMSIPFVWLYNAILFLATKVRTKAVSRDIHLNIESKSEYVRKRMDLFKSLGMI